MPVLLWSVCTIYYLDWWVMIIVNRHQLKANTRD